MPAGVKAEGPTVAIVGSGVRFELNQPFQVMQTEPDPLTLVVAWWDVTAPGAGQHGRVGLYNITLVAGNPAAEGPIGPATYTRFSRVGTALRKGTDGSELRFAKGYNAIGGMGVFSDGPETEGFSIQVGDSPPVPWESDLGLLHSADPAKGPAFYYTKQPVQPWGPWQPSALTPPPSDQ